MKSSWRKYLGQRAPRYTSYPSALHFDHSISGADYISKLNDIDLYEPLSLYLHVPFCRQLCWYCGCNMQVENYYGRARDYVDAMIAEIALVGQALNGRGRPVSVHFGGGTPNFLLGNDLNEILCAIEREIGLTDSASLSIELDPRLLREKEIVDLADLGFERFSLGVQDFDVTVQKAINRLQSFELIEACVSDIRAANITDLAFDLLYGLPYQTVTSFLQTLDKVISLSPDRVCVFGYAHMPETLPRQRMIDPSSLPNDILRGELATLADDMLIHAGYYRVGFDHYAKPDNALAKASMEGRLKRNFQGYTDEAAVTMLGFGASAISYVDGLYAQNEKNIAHYTQRVRKAEPPIAKGVLRTKRENVLAATIQDLLCSMETNISSALRNVAPAEAISICSNLEKLEADGVIHWNGDVITMADGAHALARYVAMAIDPYSKLPQPQLARAV